MADGLSTTNLANKILNNLINNTAWTAPAAIYAQLHTASPGASGTTAVSAGSSTRLLVAYAAASGGAVTITGNVGPWTNGGTSETLTDVSFWDAPTAGNFLWSAAMGSSHVWNSTDTFTLTSATVSITPLAA
jgi:hypothetical protein